MKKKAILHIIDGLGIGGAENILVGIINGLTNFENHLIILRNPETLLQKLSKETKFKNLRCENLLQIYFKRQEITRYIQENRIDIVHSHLYLSNIVARLSTPKHVRVYNSIHSIQSLNVYKKNKLTLLLEKLTYKQRHHIIAVSIEVLKDFDSWVGVKGKSTVLYNFIDDKFWLIPAKENFEIRKLHLVAVGNLRYPKNYPFAIQAFKNVRPGVSLDIYGEGNMRQQLQVEIDKFNLPVRLCGSCNNLDLLLPKYDAFLMTSFFEGQPVSLLEAMACGLPALLSDIPVLREIGGAGALYFDINDPQSLVALINAIQAGKHDLLKLSKANFVRVKNLAKKAEYLRKLTLIYNSATDN